MGTLGSDCAALLVSRVCTCVKLTMRMHETGAAYCRHSHPRKLGAKESLQSNEEEIPIKSPKQEVGRGTSSNLGATK